MPNRPIWRPYTQERTASPPIELERAEGSYLYTKSGKRIFDGISSWWLITHGHCHPVIAEAIRQQAARMDQIIFANFTHAPAEELAENILKLVPKELTRVFFTDNGSTAVESALKMALQATEQSGYPKKNKFIAFSSAYHGDTVGAMSVSGASYFNRPYRKTLFEILRAEHPTSSTASPEEFTRHFTKLVEAHHEEVAGVIIEPLLQGAGGMVVWPEAAVKQLTQIARAHNIYVIFDEVMTGFGRTGSLFALERVGISPDILCLSKGLTGGSLPLALTLCREEIFQAFYSDDKKRMFFHGHSFTGNPISCAAALANLKLFTKPETMEKIRALENTQRKALERLAEKVSISDPRVCGTVGAFELPNAGGGYINPVAGQITEEALKEGVFLRPLGGTIYLMPPFSTSPDELLWAWSVIEKIIARDL